MSYDEFNRKYVGSLNEPVASEKDLDSTINHDEENTKAESLDWAKEAYARLKKQQLRQPEAINESNSEELNIKESDLLDDQNSSDMNVLSSESNLEKVDDEINNISASEVFSNTDKQEAVLGDFDESFTWSAEVLAAQGVQTNEVSVEEIDWLGRLRRGLEKTRKGFVSQLLDKLGDDPLTPEVLDDLETLLLRADAGVEATDQVLNELRRRLNEEVMDADQGLSFLKEQLCGVLEVPIKSSGQDLLVPKKDCLNIWLLVGVNGVGKTTTLGKLANLSVRSGYSALIAAADTFRAAAVEQVQIWGDRSGVQVIANESVNADPAAVVYDAIGAAKAKEIDLLLVDTAGRLQTKSNLMDELQKVRKIISKLAPEANVESLLVLDASQGQNGLRQAMAFAKSAQLTGVVITKLDGSSRGGVALAVAAQAHLPIRFIGAGEGIRDLRPFKSFEFIEALLANR